MLYALVVQLFVWIIMTKLSATLNRNKTNRKFITLRRKQRFNFSCLWYDRDLPLLFPSWRYVDSDFDSYQLDDVFDQNCWLKSVSKADDSGNFEKLLLSQIMNAIK